MTHKVINDAIAAGLLEPCRILGPNGEDIHGYMPTRLGQRYFGPRFSAREIERENVVDLREIRERTR